jgi:hypothetical protein
MVKEGIKATAFVPSQYPLLKAQDLILRQI